MANSVDLVIASEAIKQVENLISKLNLADAELLKISQSASTASKGIAGISSPTGLDKSISNNAKLNEQLENQNKIITDLHANLAKKAEQSRLAEIRLQQAREKAFDSFEKNAKREQAIAEKNASIYNKTQTQVNTLTNAYNDLAVRKERYNNLTVNEEMRLKTLQSVTEKYNGVLKDTDAQIGKNQRNVGNYASGFNGLGNSINQITRELPAFTFSAQTGFLALSNNIPILTDEIGRLIAKNKELKASGQETTSVFKQILGGVFSLQTVMGIAILAFTLYGKEIGNFLKGTTEAKEAQKAMNEELEKSKVAVDKEIIQLRSLTSIVLDNTKSSKDRKLAYDEIKEILPGLTSETYRNAIATGELTRVTDLYTSSIIARNVVEIKSRSIAERQSKLDYEMSKSTKERMSFWEKVRVEYTAQGLTYADFTRRLQSQDKAEQDLINTDIKSLTIDVLKSNSLDSQIEKYKVNTDETKKSVKVKKEEAEALRGTEKWYNQQIAKLKEIRESTADTNDEYKAFAKQIEDLEKALKKLVDGNAFVKPNIEDTSSQLIPSTLIPEDEGKNPNEWMKMYADDVERATQEMEKLKEMTDNFISSFSSEFLQNSGLSSLEIFFDGTFDKLLEGAETTEEKFAVTFNAIAESAQEAFNFINQFQQQNFDNQRARLESQYNESLKFANGDASAQKKLADDLEKRKKEIANREAKAKQRQAMFNIAIDTAQAVVAQLKIGPKGIPLAVVVGALGAIQLAVVASQKIPQYKDGTDNHSGGLMLVNDGTGSNFREKVVTPDGKEFTPQGRNVLLDAPKGTKVLTHEQQIHEMLNERGISMNRTISNNGMNADEMDKIMAKHFSKIQVSQTNFDRRGFSSFLNNRGNITRDSSNRVQRTGIQV